MLNDEIVDEVRAIREAHAARFSFDLRAIYEDLKKSETASAAAGFTFAALPVATPDPPDGQARRRRRTAHLLGCTT